MLHGWQFLKPEDKTAILHGITGGEVRGGPYHIELDWVDRCNARCFFCNSRPLHGGDTIGFDRAVALLGQAADLRSIRLAGGGEPLLHPRVADLLAWLAGRGVALDHLNTNGITLTDAVIDALMGVTTHEVRFSLNYPDAETYGQAMGVAPRTFERVCDAVARLDAARRGNPRFGRLTVSFFVYRPTLGRIGEMYELGLRLGADKIDFRELGSPDPADALTAADVPRIASQMEAVLRDDWPHGRVESLLWSAGAGPAILQIYYRLAREFATLTPGLPRPVNFANRYCAMPWYSLTLTGSAAAWPCCFYISAPGAPTLGRLAEGALDEVWRGPAYDRLRREMRDYMLLQVRPPLFSRRMRYLLPRCASHTECPFTVALCEESFYETADSALDLLRRRPATRLWRLPNRIGRALLDRLRP